MAYLHLKHITQVDHALWGCSISFCNLLTAEMCPVEVVRGEWDSAHPPFSRLYALVCWCVPLSCLHQHAIWAGGNSGFLTFLRTWVLSAAQDGGPCDESDWIFFLLTSHISLKARFHRCMGALLELTVLVAFGHVLWVQCVVELIGWAAKQLFRVVTNQFCDSKLKKKKRQGGEIIWISTGCKDLYPECKSNAHIQWNTFQTSWSYHSSKQTKVWWSTCNYGSTEPHSSCLSWIVFGEEGKAPI